MKAMQHALAGLALCLTVTSPASAEDSMTGYSVITDLKAFYNPDLMHVIFGQDVHTCNVNKNTFLLEGQWLEKEHYVKMIFSAFLAGKEVNLTYHCNPDGKASIRAIRIR